MKFMNFYYILLAFSFLNLTHADSSIYEKYKAQINHLENSAIQEFSIDLPKDAHDQFTKHYSKAATQLEVRFQIHKKLFYKIEEKLLKLSQEVRNAHKQKLLSISEYESLNNSISYANRIIIRPRKTEIQNIYATLKDALSHSPKLDVLYHQLSDLKFKDCSLENIKFNEKYSNLSFNIKRKNNFGGWLSSTFVLTGLDVKDGRIISTPSSFSMLSPNKSFQTSFWGNQRNKDLQNFTLHLNNDGKITQAFFRDERVEPLVEFMGIKFGSQNVTKLYDCNPINRAPSNRFN